MPAGTPFHDRTLARSESLSYRDWAGYYAPSVYETGHEHEYNAIRTGAALIDISPLFKYIVTGRDAAALVNRVITRDAEAMRPGQVIYTPWCDDEGRVIDDGTVSRLAADRFRWTAAEPNLRWIARHTPGLDVTVEDVSEEVAALALQGPTSARLLRVAADANVDALKYFRVTSGTIAGRPVDISRTGYTGDLGYELWLDRADAGIIWDAIVAAGAAFGLRPVGLAALDIARVEAGLLLIDVDFASARKALSASGIYTPYEMGFDRLVDLRKPRFTGRRALAAEQARGPRRRIVGLMVDWPDVAARYEAAGLPPLPPQTVSRVPVPVFANGGQVGRVTSMVWSPMIKQLIGIATVETAHAGLGARLEVEHTVDATRHHAGATVVSMPFFNPSRKIDTPPR
jgi:aminomethyltransferase